MYDYEGPINQSVFPGHQGGPHNHTITALAVALKQAQSPEFKAYQTQVLKNAKRFEIVLKKMGYKLTTDGTDTHLVLVDLRDKKIDGSRVERILELVNIAANKNTVPGDKSALVPGGLRVGSPAMTTRGLVEKDFDEICEFLDRSVKLAVEVNGQAKGGLGTTGEHRGSLSADSCRFTGTKLKDYKEFLGEGAGVPEIAMMKKEVIDFSKKFPTVGFLEDEMKYR
jgi:glycine hydroxymethyltransferase